MKIISYNVNGIRAAIRKGLLDWLEAVDCDVICFQETKARPEQVPAQLFEDLGFQYQYWQSAEKKGYSGVAIFSKTKPKFVQVGYGDYDLEDSEGRVIRADFEDYSVMSVYMPSGTRSEERKNFKMEWNLQFSAYIQELLQEKEKMLICGDYNVAHHPIDIHNPKSNAKTSGFLPEERDWLTSFMELGFVDTFRHLNPEPHQYSWWSMRSNAREKNLGWRIDYHMITENLLDNLSRSVILSDAIHSDHAPLLVELG